MSRLPPIPASPAYAEMLEKSGELDRILDGRGLLFDNPPAPKVTPPKTFWIPAPDWDEEERERKARERQVKEAEFQTELANRLESEQEQLSSYPAGKRRFKLPWESETK